MQLNQQKGDPEKYATAMVVCCSQVNKAKRWKEICTVVNIGSSASAAFTLKKNYIRYLFDYECKFDLGGLDPTPILKEMESQGDRKRDSKKRVPSPGMIEENIWSDFFLGVCM